MTIPVPVETDERAEVSLDDLPDIDKAVPCEWNNRPGECPEPAEWHVVTRSVLCACGQITTLLCVKHEKMIREASARNDLACRRHSAAMRWLRSVPL